MEKKIDLSPLTPLSGYLLLQNLAARATRAYKSMGLHFAAPLIFLAVALSEPAQSQSETPTDQPPPISRPSFDYAFKKLEVAGADARFIQDLKKNASTDHQEKIIRTNLLGFRIKPDYTGHIQPIAIQKCREFFKKHRKDLHLAEKNTLVPAEVIVSLMWVETRLGKNLGSFLLPLSFLHVSLADHPAWIEFGIRELSLEVPPSDPTYPENVEKLRAAATRKAAWAMNELLALSEIEKRKIIQPFLVKGSYAGAFGLPQFLPSSYLKWAKSIKNSEHPNLFEPSDAIHSVANYLKEHGWGATAESQKTALYAYNRSYAYGNTILELAKKIQFHSPRRIASSSDVSAQ